MTIFSTPPPLQSAVDRYGRALGTAQMLEALHPRTRGNPGNAAALAPAMVLTGIAAFESFAEELLAITAAHRGYGFGQIAKLATMNTPTVKILDDKLTSLLGWTAADRAWTNTFTVRVWKPPAPGQSTWISAHDLTWADAINAAESWMQVRHCLAHGLVRGTRAEIWPGPLKGTHSASAVLRQRDHGKHALSIHGAESCIQIYREAGRALTDAAAATLQITAPDWASVAFFNCG
ncbi:hypothetical protein [Mycobacteroides abscessus]|uniref:hypothetical protein n=1 Tax=Mycobacteroides abscessus TaxID=36809 RepID=UPI0004693607|nr:hypothetical protein [Mycobacteroides abscessus]